MTFQTEFTLDDAVYTASVEREECDKLHDESGFRDRLIVRLDGHKVTRKGFSPPPIPDDIEAGDALLHVHMGKIAKVQAERVIKTQITVDGRRYLRASGDEVGGSRYDPHPHKLIGYNRDWLAVKKARALFAQDERAERRRALTSQIVDLCRTVNLSYIERALRELSPGRRVRVNDSSN